MLSLRLPPRLEAMVSYVIPGKAMADIGTDHALLPCAVVARGTVPNAIACDRNLRPMEAAQKNIRKAGLEHRIELRLGDGLSKLKCGEVATVVLAGMGGRTISRILEWAKTREAEPDSIFGPDCRPLRIVMQAQTDLEYLRRTLVALELTLTDESLALDRGRFYPILIANGPNPHHQDIDKLCQRNIPDDSEWNELDWKWGPILRRSGKDLYRSWLLYSREILMARLKQPPQGKARSQSLEQQWELQISELGAELDRVS